MADSGPELTAYFLHYSLRGQRCVSRADCVNAQAAQRNIDLSSISTISRFRFRPLAEQRAIAEALSDVDALLGCAGPAHRQEARPQTGRHAATPHRQDPPAGFQRASGRRSRLGRLLVEHDDSARPSDRQSCIRTHGLYIPWIRSSDMTDLRGHSSTITCAKRQGAVSAICSRSKAITVVRWTIAGECSLS